LRVRHSEPEGLFLSEIDPIRVERKKGCPEPTIRKVEALDSAPQVQWLGWTFLALLVSAVTLYFRFGRAILLGYSIAPWGDTIHVSGTLFCEASRQLRAGTIPVYDWVANEPLYFSAHMTTHYPFYFLWVEGFCSKSSAVQMADVIAVFHLLVSFGLFYVTARVLGLLRVPALFASTFYAISPDLFQIAVFPTIVAAAAWVPGIVLGILLITLRRKYALGAATMVVCAGLLFAAGPGSSMLAPTLVMAVMVGVLKCVSMIASRDWPDMARTAGAVLVAGGLIVLVTNSSTLNLLEHLEQLVRWTRHGAVFGSANAYPGEILFEKQTMADLGTLFAPSRRAFAIGSFFLGAPLVALALIGFATAWRQLEGQIAAAFVVVPVFLVFVDPWNIVLVAQYIPGFSHVRHLSFLGLPLIIGMALLAGFGITELMERRASVSLVAAVVLLTLVAAWLSIRASTTLSQDVATTVGLMTAVALGLVLAASFRLPGAPIVLCAILILHWLVIERLASASADMGNVQRTGDWANEHEPAWTEIESLLDHARMSETSPFAVAFDPSVTESGLNYGSAGTVALLLGVPSFQYGFSPRVAWKFLKTNYRYPDYAFYAAHGARYLITETPREREGLRLVSQEGEMRLYAFDNASQYVELLCAPGTAGLPISQHETIQPGRLPDAPSALADAMTAAHASATSGCPSSVSDIAIDRHGNRIAAQLAASGPRVLVINLPPYDAWKLELGGKRIRAYNFDDSQIVAWLPDGADGRATLTFAPSGYYHRLAIDMIGGALALIWLGFTLYREITSSGSARHRIDPGLG
jgi:hypothetical protein